MTDKKQTDDLEKIRPENPENEDIKVDESKAVLMERLSNLKSKHKDAKSSYKKEKFLLICVAAAFFLLFIEENQKAPSCVIILTAIISVLFLLWLLAAWSGFRPAAVCLKSSLDLSQKAVEKILKKSSGEEYEKIPQDKEG